ncbi:MAG: DNA recombination protein RmuC [Phycisphaerales bacterium]|nr:DNA recombination protein RmuC [Phycisphaerales bacterium]
MDGWLIGVLSAIGGGIVAGAVVWSVSMARRSRLQSQLNEALHRARTADDLSIQLRSELSDARTSHNDTNVRRETAERTVAELNQQLTAQQQRFDEQRKTLDEREGRMKELFAALGAEALQANTQQFLELAQKKFETLLAHAQGDSEKKQQAIDSLVKPIRELLERQQTTLTELEKKREVAYRGVEEQIRHIAASHEKLNTETGRLVSALRRPEQRGRWGELQLRNAVELAGMTAHCDFIEQMQADDGRLRPDMIVRLPGDGRIIVDSKVALDAYLDAVNPDADRAPILQRHAQQMATHVRQLSSKQYWNQFERTPKVVVMFVPLESALSAAMEVMPDLHADAMKNNVLIATPTLLVALLRAIAFGWQQESVAENAREIGAAGRELYERLGTFADHLGSLGKQLDRSVSAYNKSIGSLERMVLPATRKLRELHVSSTEINEPDTIDVETRPILASELRALPDDEPPRTIAASSNNG